MGVRVNGYPLYLFAFLSIIFVVVAIVRDRRRRLAGVREAFAVPERILWACSWILAGTYGFLVLFYVCSAMPLDNGEVEHISTAYWFKTGHLLYHAPDAAERYSVGYGPMAYLPFAVVLSVLGGSFMSCKILCAICGVTYFFFVYRCFAQQVRPKAAWLWTALVLMLSLAHWWQTFYAKADPVLYVCVIVALWAAIGPRPKFAITLFALTLGVAVNIKLPAVVYFAYPLLLFAQRTGWRAAAVALAGAGIVAALPFLHPRISFANWLYWLNQERRQGLGYSELMQNLHWFAFLLLIIAAPFMKARFEKRRLIASLAAAEKREIWVLVASVALVALSASKAGSGPNHLVPFVPLLCFAAVKLWKQSPKSVSILSPRSRSMLMGMAVAYFGTMLFMVIHGEYFMIYPLCTRSGIAYEVNSDVELILASHPGKTIAMGSGETEDFRLANFRLPLLFAGQPYWLDQTALMGHEAAGIPIPEKTREIFSKRRIDIWLIPMHAPPFELLNFYPPHRKVYDDQFVQAFRDHYEWRGSSRFFDMYEPRKVR